MVFNLGLRNYLAQTVPKRTFRLLIDPDCIEQLDAIANKDIYQLVYDLENTTPAIEIKLLVPGLSESRPPFAPLIFADPYPGEYSPINPLSDDPRAKLMENTESSNRLKRLCTQAIEEKVDGIVTNDQTIVTARYALQHDLINVVPLGELEDFVEICAHGHNVFWSASYKDAIYQDVFYILSHHKCQKLYKWGCEIQKRDLTPAVVEQLRSLILNRYPFILYARDMVKFGRIQKDHFKRLGDDRFGFNISYHVNQFYFLLWGMLDQLTLLSNMVLKLGLRDKQCGIASTDYLKMIQRKAPNLRRFLSMPTVADWIAVMSDFRHAVAHQVIPVPTELVVETDDSKRTKEEIVRIIQTQEEWSFLGQVPNGDVRELLINQAVADWRHRKMKRVADHMVLLKNKDGYYWRSPVISIDHDLAILTGIMDAFFFAMFNTSDCLSESLR